MTDQELLQAMRQMLQESEARMSQMMDQKLDQRLQESETRMGQKLDRKLEPILQRLDAIEESLEEVRDSTNMLISWSEKVSTAIHFPLPAIDE